MTLTITNNTGGTIKDIFLDDVLPPQYVVDPTYWSGGSGHEATACAPDADRRPEFHRSALRWSIRA